MKVLLVDDHRDNQVLLRSFLKNTAAELVIASNGQEGIEKIKQEEFDLVLMDIEMTVMDGIEAIKQIRTFNQGLRVCALTAHNEKARIDYYYKIGFSDHLAKPVSRKSLIEKLGCSLKKTIIEVAVDEGFQQLAQEYLEGKKLEIEDLFKAYEKEEFALIAKQAHKMKGVAASYGFDLLTQLGGELEEQALVENEQSVLKKLKEVESYLERVRIRK